MENSLAVKQIDKQTGSPLLLLCIEAKPLPPSLLNYHFQFNFVKLTGWIRGEDMLPEIGRGTAHIYVWRRLTPEKWRGKRSVDTQQARLSFTCADKFVPCGGVRKAIVVMDTISWNISLISFVKFSKSVVGFSLFSFTTPFFICRLNGGSLVVASRKLGGSNHPCLYFSQMRHQHALNNTHVFRGRRRRRRSNPLLTEKKTQSSAATYATPSLVCVFPFPFSG